MLIKTADLSKPALYFLQIQTIVPRPIAWVLSDNGSGEGKARFNLAPFSYFNGVCSDPPIISISVGKKQDGSKKDTWLNIEDRSYFVVHSTNFAQATAMNTSAAGLEHGVSEFLHDDVDVELTHESAWPLPRIAGAPVAMLCERHQIIEVGNGPQALILGEMKEIFLDDAVAALDANSRLSVDPVALDHVARLGGNSYMKTGEVFDLPRP